MIKKNSRMNNPLIFEKTLDGEIMYDVFSRLMKERIIFIAGVIEEENTNSIIAQLLWLDNQSSKKEINLYINSPGGELECLFALYDVIQFIKAPVCTFAIGRAESAAAVLLACGSRGCRCALPNATIMLHQPIVSGFEGQVTDVSIQAKQLEMDKKRVLEIVAKHTGQIYEKVLKDCERDLFLSPKEALKYGLIDSITSPQKEIPPLLKEIPVKRKRKELIVQ